MLHITSTSGLIGNMGQANYASAKLGITALSKAIAIDMKRFNVRSNCLSPWAWSRMTQSIPARTEEERARVAKIQQMTPDKNAPMAVFLASDAARDVTGQVFGTRMNEIYLFSSPRPKRSLHRADGWSPEAIAEHALPALAILVHAARPLGRAVLLGPAVKSEDSMSRKLFVCCLLLVAAVLRRAPRGARAPPGCRTRTCRPRCPTGAPINLDDAKKAAAAAVEEVKKIGGSAERDRYRRPWWVPDLFRANGQHPARLGRGRSSKRPAPPRFSAGRARCSRMRLPAAGSVCVFSRSTGGDAH